MEVSPIRFLFLLSDFTLLTNLVSYSSENVLVLRVFELLFLLVVSSVHSPDEQSNGNNLRKEDVYHTNINTN